MRELRSLPLHTLLLAAFATYLPSQPEDERGRALDAWCAYLGLPPGFDVARFMSTESEALTWKAEGLPSDALSVQNAVAILHSTTAPLLVDPSTAAATWRARARPARR